jgi:hypothetical protein
MAIEDEIEALKMLVARVFSKKPKREIKPYDPGISDEMERRRNLAKRMYRILTRNARS